MRLIVLHGAKHSKKELVAQELAQNSDCWYIKPYTDRVNDTGHMDDIIRLNKSKLDDKLDKEDDFCITEVNGYRYVFFANQLTSGYVALIGDDRVVRYLKHHWDDELVTVKVHSNDEEESDRFTLPDKDFDIVFNYDSDDIDELAEQISDIYFFRG